MIPAFRVMVAGEDATGKVADRLLGLTITDEDGSKADRLELELDNRDGGLAFPDTEARIEVSLGYRGLPLSLMGVYAVDGVSGSGPRLTMRITATAADLKGDIRAPRTRGWEGKSLRDIVGTIAGEAARIGFWRGRHVGPRCRQGLLVVALQPGAATQLQARQSAPTRPWPMPRSGSSSNVSTRASGPPDRPGGRGTIFHPIDS